MRLIKGGHINTELIVSIHALTRSATLDPDLKGSRACFNPRTHEECDKVVWDLVKPKDVSIHALTRSATVLEVVSSNLKLFQSTHSRGVRRFCDKANIYSVSFNPRTHEECDDGSFAPTVGITEVSIHALTRSATVKALLKCPACMFQSTHSRGVRR